MNLRVVAFLALGSLVMLGAAVAYQYTWTMRHRSAPYQASQEAPTEQLTRKLGELKKGKSLLSAVVKSKSLPPFPQVRAAGQEAGRASR